MSIVLFSFELAQQLYESTEKCPVSFDDAWQWLEYSTKGNAKRTLEKNFALNEDYRVIKVDKSAPVGGLTHREDIFLTVNCFKELGMIAGTEKGREVRQHFIRCEQKLKEMLQTQSQPKPQSPLEVLQQQIEALAGVVRVSLEHERKIAALEAKNVELEEKSAELEHLIEAVDMETAANTAELERFRNGHGFFFSIAGWCSKHGIKKPFEWMKTQGRKASALCKAKGLQPVPVNDPRFGMVNTYPDSVLAELNWE